MKEVYTIAEAKALTQDELSSHTWSDERNQRTEFDDEGTRFTASDLYNTLTLTVVDAEGSEHRIEVIRRVADGIEVDTPEYYATWEEAWAEMYQEFLGELNAIEG